MNRDKVISALAVFSLVYPIVYTVAYYRQWAVFRYYPMVGEVHLAAQPATLGPAMTYYGWIALSAFVAAGVAIIVPARQVLRIWTGWLWVIPFGATLFTLGYETRWFLP